MRIVKKSLTDKVRMDKIKHRHRKKAVKVLVDVYLLSERGSHRLKASLSSDKH